MTVPLLVVLLAGVSHVTGVVTAVIASGPQLAAEGEMTRVAALYFACFGVYLLLGVIYFIFWRWLRRDLPMLVLGILALFMAIHSAGISGTLPILFPATIDAQTSAVIERASYLLLGGLTACALWAFFPHAFYPAASSPPHVMNTGIAGLAVAVSGGLTATAFLGGTGDSFLALSRWLTAAVTVAAAIIAYRILGSRVENRGVTIVGLVLLVIGGIYDVLFAGLGDAGRAYVMPFGLLVFILLQSYVMIRRTAESTLRAQVSGRRLRRQVEVRTQELQAAMDAAQAANLAKTEFVNAVTHELRTPLSSMLGYIELLREELEGKLSSEHSEFFETLDESGQRLLNLVNNLLDLAKIESGRVEVNLEPVDVTEVIEQVQSELYPLAKEKKLFLEKDVDAEHALVLADAQWLSVVLSDLVSNAIKYTHEGGVTLRVMRSMRDSSEAVAIKVIDTGPGISPEFLPYIFEPFSREDPARAGSAVGTGLGLTIARELVGLMNGEVLVETELGVGSSFTLLLPTPDEAVTEEPRTEPESIDTSDQPAG